MLLGLPRDVWIEKVAHYLSFVDVSRLGSTCRAARVLFALDPVFWQRHVERVTAISTAGLPSTTPWRWLFVANYMPGPDAGLQTAMRRAVMLQHIVLASSLPPSHAQGARWFLYWWWSGAARVADHLRIIPLTATTSAQPRQANAFVRVKLEAPSPQLLLASGYQGLSTVLDVVCVSRTLPGNRAVVATLDVHRHPPRGGLEEDPAQRQKWNRCLCSRNPVGSRVDLHVSTPTKAHYQDIGRTVHGSPDFFHDMAASRAVNAFSHAESRSHALSSEELDRYQQRAAGPLPNIAAGGVTQLRVMLSVEEMFATLFASLDRAPTRPPGAHDPFANLDED